MGWGCPGCGATNVAGTRFCGHCGRARDEISTATRTSEADAPEGVSRSGPSAAPAEERRLVTVLFADLSGFTSLAEELDPEQLVEVMDPVLGTMSRVVDRYGGTVSKFAGDAVLAFFGAPRSHGDDAARAVLAACDMRREVAALTERLIALPRAFGLHIGINTGHVVTGQRGLDAAIDYSVLGDAVNVAQRLEAAAPLGEIYVGDLTRQLAGEVADFDELGALTVKGKRIAVHAWRVGERAGAFGSPSRVARAPLVGRDRQLALMPQVLSLPGSIVGVIGEPGVGKSRLVQAAAEAWVDSGHRWLTGRCTSYGSNLPYRPYIDLLHDVVGASRDQPTDEVVARVAELAVGLGLDESVPYLARLLGETSVEGIDEHVLPEAVRSRTHDAVATLLASLAQSGPLVVAIEDLHWSDEATRTLTAVLASRARASGIVVVATLRPEGKAYFDHIAASPSSQRTVFDLVGLDREGVRLLVEAVLQGGVSDDAVDLLYEHASGNPLFVEETALALRDSGALQRTAAGWRLQGRAVDLKVPPTVEAVLAARIDSVSTEQAAVLQAAAVIGREVPLALLEKLAPADREQLLRIVNELVERGFLEWADRAGARVVFHHALVVSVAYERLLRRQRRDIHRAVVSAATSLYGAGDDVVELLAHHAYRGEMTEAAVGLLHRAARRAARLYANEEALSHLSRAVEVAEGLSSSSPSREELLLEMAALLSRRGDYEAALAIYQEIAARRPVAAAVGASDTLRKLGRYAEAHDVAAAARDAATNDEERAALVHQRGTSVGFNGDSETSVSLLREALDIVDGTGSVLEAEIRIDLGRAVEFQEAHEEALRHVQLAAEIFDALGELEGLSRTLRILGGVQASLAEDARDPDSWNGEATRTLERAHAVAHRIGHAEEEAAALVNLGSHLSHVRPEDALAPLRSALEIFERISLKGGVACAYANLAETLGRLSRFEEMAEAAEAGLAVAREIDHKYWISGCLLGLAQAALGRGDALRAAELATEAAGIADAAGILSRSAFARELVAQATAQQM